MLLNAVLCPADHFFYILEDISGYGIIFSVVGLLEVWKAALDSVFFLFLLEYPVIQNYMPMF